MPHSGCCAGWRPPVGPLGHDQVPGGDPAISRPQQPVVGQRSGGQEGLDDRCQVLMAFQRQPHSPNACISARASSGLSRTLCTSPSSSGPESSSDRCAAATAAGAVTSARSATTNSATTCTRASTDATPGTVSAWHRHPLPIPGPRPDFTHRPLASARLGCRSAGRQWQFGLGTPAAR
jgi:hypothetical protein